MIGVYNPDDHEFSFLKKTEVPIYRESNINVIYNFYLRILVFRRCSLLKWSNYRLWG